MEKVNTYEVERKIGYWQHVLSKIKMDMLKIQSVRLEIEQKLAWDALEIQSRAGIMQSLARLDALQSNLDLKITRLESEIKWSGINESNNFIVIQKRYDKNGKYKK